MDYGLYAEMGTHTGFQLRKDVTYLSFKKDPSVPHVDNAGGARGGVDSSGSPVSSRPLGSVEQCGHGEV